MNYIARVNPRYFAAMTIFAAEKDVRYYLCGVHIERHPEKGVVMVATNGHILAVIHDPEGELIGRDSIIVGGIPKSLITACTARTKKGDLPADKLWIAEHCAVLSFGDEAPEPFDSTTNASVKIELIDGQFPDWKRVLPKTTTPVKRFPLLNGSYVARFAQAAKILVPNKYGNALDIQPTGDACSVTVRIPEDEMIERFFGMIMPLNTSQFDLGKSRLPAWLPQPEIGRVKYRGDEKVSN